MPHHPMDVKMRRWLLGLALTVTPALAHAEDWPEHGFFRVQSGEDGGQGFCRLRAEASVSGRIFALVLRDNADGTLLAQFLAQAGGVADAERVVIGIDGKALLSFLPEARDRSQELPSVTARVADGAGFVTRLRRLAEGAEWLQVATTSGYGQSIPAEGLKEAVTDLDACRASRE